jgi:enolase
VKIIGDDLTVTNTTLLTKAAEAQSIDGLIIKPNQIGTISETVAAISEAHRRGLVCIVSHRSGETMDTTIADIVVAFQCFGLKSGAPAPKERLVKYERLIAISQ